MIIDEELLSAAIATEAYSQQCENHSCLGCVVKRKLVQRGMIQEIIRLMIIDCAEHNISPREVILDGITLGFLVGLKYSNLLQQGGEK